MIVKKRASVPKLPSVPLVRWLARRSWWSILALFAILTAVEILALGVAVWELDNKLSQRSGWPPFRDQVFRDLRRQCLRWWYWNATTEPLHLEVDWESWQKIRFDREQAIIKGFNISGDNFWAPAVLAHEEERLGVKLRLKGAMQDHWLDPEKWSLLIKVRGNRTFRGMKRFSIQHPGTRDFFFEWLALRAFHDEGLIALRFDFVEVIINGESHGVYALEEQIGKHLIEHHRLREGPIVGFDKTFWLRLPKDERFDPDLFLTAAVDATESGAIVPGSPEAATYLEALSLLEGFRAGELTASEVFDVEHLAKLTALYALFSAYELDWKDLMFYYNPLTGRLMPIGKEIVHQPELGSWWRIPGHWPIDEPRSHKELFIGRLLGDPEVCAAYVAELDRISQPAYLDALLRRHEKELEIQRSVLRREFLASELVDPGPVMRGAQERIRAILHPPEGLQAHDAGIQDGVLELEVGVLQSFPLEVTGVVLADGRSLEPSERARFAGKQIGDPVRYQTVRFELPPLADTSEATRELRLRYRASGLAGEREAAVSPWPYEIGSRSELAALQTPRSLDVPFLAVDEAKREIDCLPGEWEIREPLVIPAGYRFRCLGEVRWDLRDGAFVIFRSPVLFRGSEERPVVIESSDGTGQGLAVIEAGGESVLENVVVRGLSAPTRGGWALTGALTFYESPVRIESCSFTDNVLGDDLLNFFRSDFVLRDSFFGRVPADAVDADYSDGELSRLVFRDIGNDAIDGSGSRLELRRVLVDGAGDKGLSFGERSTGIIEGAEIRRAKIGLASKDASEVTVSGASISDSQIGVAAYQKKPEYGPGAVKATGLELATVETAQLIERGSSFILDGETLPDDQENLRDRLYGDQ